jgi:endoglucanase
VVRLALFLGWCQVNGVRGFIGEYGIPNDDPDWQKVLKPFLAALDRAEVDSCAWAAGEWRGSYRLAMRPTLLTR